MAVTPHAAVIRRCFVNAPWYDLKEKFLDLFVEYGLQPEIGLEGNCLYDEDIPSGSNKHRIIKTLGGNCT